MPHQGVTDSRVRPKTRRTGETTVPRKPRRTLRRTNFQEEQLKENQEDRNPLTPPFRSSSRPIRLRRHPNGDVAQWKTSPRSEDDIPATRCCRSPIDLLAFWESKGRQQRPQQAWTAPAEALGARSRATWPVGTEVVQAVSFKLGVQVGKWQVPHPSQTGTSYRTCQGQTALGLPNGSSRRTQPGRTQPADEFWAGINQLKAQGVIRSH
jgi:hypothetical protein